MSGSGGPGTLFVVATPIGNLEDITLRALRVLREVQLVAAEDTRRTGNLLRHYEIRTPLISVHEHNERHRTPRLLMRLAAGESVALVTDAGTPGVSDPGGHLVAAAREHGIRIEPIPGPSAVMAAISAAGHLGTPFVFLGFPPVRSKARKHFWARIADLSDFLVVIFEAPHRVLRTLEELANLVNRPILLARELTKAHEEILAGMPTDVLARLETPKGEITILVWPESLPDSAAKRGTGLSDAEIVGMFGQITENAPSRREAIRTLAEREGLAPRDVYKALERSKNIVQSS